MSISVGGLASGLDTNSIIEQLMEVQQRPITMLQQQEAAYQVELSAYGTLQGELSNLKTALENLDSVDGLTGFSASSGSADFVSVSADDSATSGSYSLTITQMADVHKLTSGAFSEAETVGEGTLHLMVGSGTATDIDVTATDTIDDVAQSINEADAGVSAAVIFDGSNYFLALTAEETGVDNVINLTVTDTGDANNTDLNGLSRLVFDSGVTENLSNTQDAADAIITLDGVADIHRDSNIINDVIQGVTITIDSAPDAPDNTATISVSRDTAVTISKIDAFVSEYNTVLEFFDAYQEYDKTSETAGVLQGDATTNGIRNRLENSISNTISGVESFNQLGDLGIALNSKGLLEANTATLTDALNDHFDEVLQFFTQSTEGAEGFAVRMADTLDGILDTTDGSIAARTTGIQSSIDAIEDQVERVEMRNLAWETRTRAQFNSLELLLAEYQTTGNYLSQQIAGLQNLNNYVANRG
jgi:flagellar hook-associated protein 2